MDDEVMKIQTDEERILELIAEAKKMKSEVEQKLEQLYYELGVERMKTASNEVLDRLRG